MKTIIKLSFVAILLLCSTFANELADSTLYKVKLDDSRSGACFSPSQAGVKLAFKF